MRGYREGLLLWAAKIPGAGRRWRVTLAVALTALTPLTPLTALAQPADWTVVAGGRAEVVRAPALAEAVARRVEALRDEGFALARLDSTADSTAWVARGPRVRVRTVRLVGAEAVDSLQALALFSTRPGRAYRPAALEADVEALLDRYERVGRPLAEVAVREVAWGAAGPEPVVDITLAVEEGAGLRLAGLELEGGGRVSEAWAARAAGLRLGQPLVPYDPDAIQRRLEETGFFEEVGRPVLEVDADGGARLRLDVTPVPPGTFDLVLGYLPRTGPGEGGLVGSGSLALLNPFGHGRELAVELERAPGRASTLDARVADPFVAGLPLRAALAFSGLQQDSTFSRQRFEAELGYPFAPGLEGVVTVAREAVEPGVAGAALVDGRPRVASSSAFFGGVGVRYRDVDRPLNPRRGVRLSATVEQGGRRRALPPDSFGVLPGRLLQRRLSADARVYVPTLRRQLVALGLDARVLLSGAPGEAAFAYDEGDLFRFGGARSLRGYDEGRFRGHVVGRALAEYRLQLDRASFVFGFVDVGYVSRPATPVGTGRREWRPGYGAGLQYRTGIGVVTATYALNPEDGFAGGRVHAGVSVGL